MQARVVRARRSSKEAPADVGFEGLARGGGEEDLVEREAVSGGFCDGDVAAVRRVEGAAEESNSH